MRNAAAVFALLLLLILAGLASATDWQTVVALDFGQFLATRQARPPAPPPVDPDDDEIGTAPAIGAPPPRSAPLPSAEANAPSPAAADAPAGLASSAPDDGQAGLYCPAGTCPPPPYTPPATDEPPPQENARPPGRWTVKPVRAGLLGRRVVYVYEYQQP